MRNKIIIIVFISAFKINAQVNLVPNPSFESYTCCPNSTGQLSCTENWVWVGASTDYYNSCAISGGVSVPSNIYGYQIAIGNAYVGMNTFIIGETAPFTIREPIGSQLISPLQIGQKYFLSFKAVLTLNDFESCCASNKLGALLSTIPFSNQNPAPVNNFAHVYSNSIITDTLNWTTINGSFIADSNYNFISIGNFYTSINTQTIDFKNNYPQTTAAYYYIDDVRLSTDSLFTVQSLAKKEINKKISVWPNPFDNLINISSSFQIKETQIFNSEGIQLIENNTPKSVLNLSHFKSGIYTLILKDNNLNKYYYKIIKL
ncbi:MAG: T9SS type A sorting domain-containing protein [Sphingobacteriaceae bacterium]|nr:T9SS type A sorting domain-containing protein [Sphingobacteriaceae bacterium]